MGKSTMRNMHRAKFLALGLLASVATFAGTLPAAAEGPEFKAMLAIINSLELKSKRAN